MGAFQKDTLYSEWKSTKTSPESRYDCVMRQRPICRLDLKNFAGKYIILSTKLFDV